MKRYVNLGPDLPPALRLGLATRGNTRPNAEDVLLALEHGINYWNWCGHEDGMSEAIRQLGDQRSQVIIATQISVASWTRDAMLREAEATINQLGCGWLDVVTLYYVESEHEWTQITAPSGAIRALEDAKRDGLLRMIGLTTHQRQLAVDWVQTGLLDLIMIRYNAAHRGAESEVFPITDKLGLPVVCFTGLRWGQLLKPTPDDPPSFEVPAAPQWYRFVISNPAVAVALMAPHGRDELQQNLSLLQDWRALSPDEWQDMAAHGDRVRHHAGPFP